LGVTDIPGALGEVAAVDAERRRTVLEVAVGALTARDGCACVIAGATTPEQVKANAAAAEWVPSASELADVDRIVPPPTGR
jgi:aryl-alcohol dehydrogenase-like predicted oxidoreductase